MITAEQARRIAIFCKSPDTTVEKELKNINKYIKKASRVGEMSILYVSKSYKHKAVIKEKLQEFGYRVQDVYDFRSIEISWRAI